MNTVQIAVSVVLLLQVVAMVICTVVGRWLKGEVLQ